MFANGSCSHLVSTHWWYISFRKYGYLCTITDGVPITSIITSRLKRWLFVITQIIKWNITWRLEARFVFFYDQSCILKSNYINLVIIWYPNKLIEIKIFNRCYHILKTLLTSFSSIESADFSIQSKHCEIIGNTSLSTSTDLTKKFLIHFIRFSSRSWKFCSTDGESSV